MVSNSRVKLFAVAIFRRRLVIPIIPGRRLVQPRPRKQRSFRSFYTSCREESGLYLASFCWSCYSFQRLHS